MNKTVTVNRESITVSIEVKRIDKYNHILILDGIEHPISIVVNDSLDERGEKLFSHYVYKGEKVLDKSGKVVNTDKGLVEFILNKNIPNGTP